MTDIVERLRDGVARKASGHSALWDSIMAEAADEIERLQADYKEAYADLLEESCRANKAEAENEKLRAVYEAAKKFAKECAAS